MSQPPSRFLRYAVLLIAAASGAGACGSTEAAADPDRFCEILAQLDAQDTSGLPADEALTIISEGRALYVEGVEVAPEEIKAEAETFANGVIQITDLLIAAGGDESQVDIAAMESVTEDILTPEFDAAAGEVNAWKASNCS
ncbi:MAG: hypothetical protein HKN03_14985 [Acidimicrobiales bacterium]|nr:hypothetical protein [Acidimicrobiales bacterium]